MYLTQEKEEAKDLLQDTYLRALSANFEAASYAYICSWMLTIMKNIFINNYKRKSRTRDYCKMLSCFIDNTTDLQYNYAETNYTNLDIYYALNGLSKQCKLVLILYAMGYKYNEIAEKMNLPVTNVRSKIYYSRQKLKSKLKDYI